MHSSFWSIQLYHNRRNAIRINSSILYNKNVNIESTDSSSHFRSDREPIRKIENLILYPLSITPPHLFLFVHPSCPSIHSPLFYQQKENKAISSSKNASVPCFRNTIRWCLIVLLLPSLRCEPSFYSVRIDLACFCNLLNRYTLFIKALCHLNCHFFSAFYSQLFHSLAHFAQHAFGAIQLLTVSTS